MINFLENFVRRTTATIVQVNNTKRKGVSNVAKSSYYRSAIILTCSIVEGFVFQLAKTYSKKNKNIIEEISELRIIHDIPENVFNKKDIVIAEKQKRKVIISENGNISFRKLNNYLKKEKVVSQKLFSQLEMVRKERNKIHIQSLKGKDTGYTKSKLIQVSKPIPNLFYLLDKFNR